MDIDFSVRKDSKGDGRAVGTVKEFACRSGKITKEASMESEILRCYS
jgi:hypothetical protein